MNILEKHNHRFSFWKHSDLSTSLNDGICADCGEFELNLRGCMVENCDERICGENMKNEHAVILGRKGGLVKSEAKATAVRQNGLKGGRPRKSASPVDKGASWAEKQGNPSDSAK